VKREKRRLREFEIRLFGRLLWRLRGRKLSHASGPGKRAVDGSLAEEVLDCEPAVVGSRWVAVVGPVSLVTVARTS
jgi:hypothetical protein